MRAFRYQLSLNRPLELQGRLHTTRQGLLLRTDGGWGDAAPLPGFSRETLDDVIAEWRAGPPFTSPSLKFAHASAQRPVVGLTVPINALLLGSDADVVNQARCLAGSACPAVKLKVGRHADVADDVRLVRQVRQQLRPDQHLRLDANRAWDQATATTFGHGVAGCDLEYIEEPLRQPELLEDFYAETHVPYALDETLTEPYDVSDFSHASALICKPTLLGGRDRIEQLARTGKPLVLSACFESGIGLSRIAQWADDFSPGCPVGLDTYSWLSNDLLRSALDITDWSMRIPPDVEVDTSSVLELQR